MKKFSNYSSAAIMAILLLVAVSSECQTTYDGYTAIIGRSGYQEAGEADTIPAKMLITECDTCNSRSVRGYAVRRRLTYFGDKMPPGTYDDIWQTRWYLDDKKIPLAKDVTVWMAALK